MERGRKRKSEANTKLWSHAAAAVGPLKPRNTFRLPRGRTSWGWVNSRFRVVSRMCLVLGSLSFFHKFLNQSLFFPLLLIAYHGVFDKNLTNETRTKVRIEHEREELLIRRSFQVFLDLNGLERPCLRATLRSTCLARNIPVKKKNTCHGFS